MSDKDRELLRHPQRHVIENGVDLDRFEPPRRTPGRRLLFIGSFRHFPNIVAFRFLMEEIFPQIPDAELTVVAGPDPWTALAQSHRNPATRLSIRASSCLNSSPMSARSTAKPTSSWFRRSNPPEPT